MARIKKLFIQFLSTDIHSYVMAAD